MLSTMLSTAVIENAWQTHQRFLWGICYRMTGNAADADDLVQETFVRAIKHPPARADEPWRPWLVRIAINLSRDLLRYRRRRKYDGPWLPSPVETGEATLPPSYEPTDDEGNPAARYDLIESVSFAFLLALEALTPAQRAVLLLRDVFDYSVRETAEALAMTEVNVKTTHHRARKVMRSYDQTRRPLTSTLQQQTREVMERFLSCLFNQDVAGAAALLTEDVQGLNDGGGEFISARVPVTGKQKILLFYSNLMKLIPQGSSFAWQDCNGLPALISHFPHTSGSYAPLTVTQCQLDETGRIRQIHIVLASRKLTHLKSNALVARTES